MKKIEKIKRKFNNFMYDHIYVKESLNIAKGTFIAAFTALLYAFGFYCFVAPSVIGSSDAPSLAGSAITTGGVGGVSQVIWMLSNLFGGKLDLYIMQSVLYFGLNIPILIFAFFKIGKKFSILTLINVGLSSLFIQLLKDFDLAKQIAYELRDEHLARVLFAGVSIGLASSIAFRCEISCGGIDVISYYFALRKSTSVGKYAMALNMIILVSYFGLTLANNKGAYSEIAFLSLLFSFLYLFVVMLVVDFVNIRNKKVQIQIITSFADISSVLIANFPHSTTTVAAKGGYSHSDKTIVYMVVSSNEVKKVVSLVKRIDQHSFITVTSLVQAYGNFFIKPIE